MDAIFHHLSLGITSLISNYWVLRSELLVFYRLMFIFFIFRINDHYLYSLQPTGNCVSRKSYTICPLISLCHPFISLQLWHTKVIPHVMMQLFKWNSSVLKDWKRLYIKWNKFNEFLFLKKRIIYFEINTQYEFRWELNFNFWINEAMLFV